MAAGSLLGVSLSRGDSFPVGKVDFLQMYPISFKEFLYADDRRMFDYLEGVDSLVPLPEIVMGKVAESYRRYLVCGGMPAAVTALLEERGTQAVETVQKAILAAYALDFAKHAPTKDIPRIAAVWDSIPSQLARENRKFLYTVRSLSSWKSWNITPICRRSAGTCLRFSVRRSCSITVAFSASSMSSSK